MFSVWKPADMLQRQSHMKVKLLTGAAGLGVLIFMTGCSSASATAQRHRSATPDSGCHFGAAAGHRTLTLSYTDPQPRLSAAVGDVIEVSAQWSAPLARPRAYPRGMVCEFNATSGKTATADFLLLKPGHVTFGTSDQVATPAMDPAFFGHVNVHSN
jgi:hypothetical protein